MIEIKTPKANRYLKGSETSTITISLKVYERLIRRKNSPNESFGSVVDRIVKNKDPSSTVFYDSNQIKEFITINISKNAHKRLTRLKNIYEYENINEAIWRLMTNEKLK